ncbi:hypothetical protein GW17_00056674 [Ensete ventricosum]|nr:hypothetical protein GW17_00056674 [Ensete ventricosum]
MRTEQQLQRSPCTLLEASTGIRTDQPIGLHPVKRGDRPPLQPYDAGRGAEDRKVQVIHRHPHKPQAHPNDSPTSESPENKPRNPSLPALAITHRHQPKDQEQ